MEVWLLEVYEGNTYSYSGESSKPYGIFSTKELADAAGRKAVASGYNGFSTERYTLDKTN